MLGKGVKISDCLLAIAILLPIGAAVGAGIVLAGRFAQTFVGRRVRARDMKGQK